MRFKNAMLWIVVVFAFGNVCFGQTYWEKNYSGMENETYSTIIPTTDNNFLVAGYTCTTFAFGDGDLYTIVHEYKNGLVKKISQKGETLWARIFERNNNNDFLQTIFPTNEGNYLIVGMRTESIGGQSDGWLVKITPNGDTLWTKTFGGTGHNELSNILQTKDGNFLLTGLTGGYSWLIKINPEGDTLWTRTFGTSYSYLESILQTTEGNFLLAVPNSNLETGKVWLIKIDADGTTLWTRNLGGTGQDYCHAMTQTSDRNFLLAGSSGGHGWLIKVSADGDSLWSKTFGVTQYDYFQAIIQTGDGNFLLKGVATPQNMSEIWLVKIKPNGDTLWTKTLTGFSRSDYNSENVRTFLPDKDGNFILMTSMEKAGMCSISAWSICIIADKYAYKDSSFTYKIPAYSVDTLKCEYTPLIIPIGMTISPGGTISWTPTTDSVYREHAEFIVKNDTTSDTLTFNIFVNSDYHAPTKVISSRITNGVSKPIEAIVTYSSNKIKFSLPLTTTAICIYDINGRLVDKVKPTIPSSGTFAVWPRNGSYVGKIPTGKYFAKVSDGKNSIVKPFLFVQ
jgi:hypothetical protein